MQRSPHFLSRLKGDYHPTRIIGLACDSTGERADAPGVVVNERLQCWCASGWARASKGEVSLWEDSGASQDAFWRAVDYAVKRNGQTWVVSNGACRVWGLLGLWDLLETGKVALDGARIASIGHSTGYRGETVEAGIHKTSAPVRSGRGDRSGDRQSAPIVEDPPTVIRIRLPGRTGCVTIVDIRNYGIDFGTHRESAEIEARRARDALLSIDTLLRDNRWGSLRASSGAQAWSIWRTALSEHPVLVHRNADALELEGAAYYGGRCECRFIGRVKGTVYHVDFRNLYPAICAHAELPSLFVRCELVGRNASMAEFVTPRKAVAEVILETRTPDYPYRRDGQVIYPVGRFSTALAGPELNDAITRGCVRSIGRVATYRTNQALARFARELLRVLQGVRQWRDDILAQFLKRSAVAAVGRLGQRGYSWVPTRSSSPDPIWGEWWRPSPDGELTHYRAIAGQTYMEQRWPWAPESCPAMAAHINSAGRMALLNAIRQAGWENVYYYDTDSLIVNETGFQYLWLDRRIRHDTAGFLRLVTRADECEILGIKHYILDGERRCAGLPKGEQHESALPGCYWYLPHARAQIGEAHKPLVQQILQEYAREAVYQHGIVGDDGWVRPLEID